MSIDDTIFWSAIFIGVLVLVLVKGEEWYVKRHNEKERKEHSPHSDHGPEDPE